MRRRFAVRAQGIVFDGRVQEARVHIQHPHAQRFGFQAKHFEELRQGALGRAVGSPPRHRDPAGHGADIDHQAAARLERRQAALGERHRRLPVDVHHAVEHRQVGGAHGRAVGDAGVVDQAIQAAETLLDLGDEPCPAIGVGQVAGHAQDTVGRPQGLFALGEQCGVHVDQHHGIAAGEEALREFPAQATGGPGDHCDRMRGRGCRCHGVVSELQAGSA